MKDRRKHQRTSYRARVRIVAPRTGAGSFETRDMSEGGVYLYCGGEVVLPEGTDILVQDDEIIMEPPLARARVVRVEPQGIALIFVDR